jgi:5-methylthioadenosine/S-adenosylhomocysteine deaminase
VTATDALFAATLGGARALGLDDKIGALKPGMQADLAIVNLSAAHQTPVTNPADALVFSSSAHDVILTMVAGREIFRASRVNAVDQDTLESKQERVRAKLATASQV